MRLPVNNSYRRIAPANKVIEYEDKVFNSGFFTKANKYMGFPTKETDKAWSDLFNCRLLVANKSLTDSQRVKRLTE